MLHQFIRRCKETIAINDPEGRNFQLAIRTSLACCLSTVLFQIIGNIQLAGWAGFAALAFIQIDTLDLFSKRLKFLLAHVLVFALLALIGICLSTHPFLFALTVPFVIFICGYIAAFGEHYFNAGGWAAFLYIAFGSNLGSFSDAVEVSLTFVIVGILCILISTLIFPERPFAKMIQSVERVIDQLRRFNNQDVKNIRKFTWRLEKLLQLQNNTLKIYISSRRISPTQKSALLNASKSLYQAMLIMETLSPFTHRIAHYNTYAETSLQECYPTTATLIERLVIQLKTKKITAFDLTPIIRRYHKKLRIMQVEELQKEQPDFKPLLDYSSYLYHFIKLWQTLDALSNDFKQLFEAAKE